MFQIFKRTKVICIVCYTCKLSKFVAVISEIESTEVGSSFGEGAYFCSGD